MQYPTQTQTGDFIPIQKGVTATFPISANSDVRGCLLFGEIKRAIPGRQEANFYVTTTQGSPALTINLLRNPNNFNLTLPASISVREGDRVDVPGAGIVNALVVATTTRSIVVDRPATLALRETRLIIKAPTLANFTFIPKTDLTKITTTEITTPTVNHLKIGTNKVLIGGNLVFNQYQTLSTTKTPASLKKDTILVFNNNGVATEVKLSSDSNSSNGLNIYPLQNPLPSGSTTVVGASTVILRENCQHKHTILKVRPLKIPIARNTILNFGYKDARGWRQTGSVIVAKSTLENSLEIPILPYSQKTPIPTNSIAYFGTTPITSFYLTLDPVETQNLETGSDYACDIIATNINGTAKKIAQIDRIKFLDSWSDLT